MGNKFNTTLGLIVGLPYETPDTLAKGMEWVLDLESPVDSFTLFALKIRNSVFPSEFLKNYANYGYQLDNSGSWYNKTWSLKDCIELSEHYNKIGFNSGKQKLTNQFLFYLSVYGYDMNELKDIPLKELDWNKFKQDFENYYVKYMTTLLDYENISFNRSSI